MLTFLHNLLCLCGGSAGKVAPAPATLHLSKAAVDDAKRNGVDPFASISTHLKYVELRHGKAFDTFKANTGKKHAKDFRPITSGDVTPRANGQGSEPTTPQSDKYLWTGEVEIGTPGQKLQLQIDTGSSDLLVLPKKYDYSKSSTSVDTNKKFRTSFADGSTGTGTIYEETVSVAGCVAKKQAFGNIDKTTVDIANADGVLGLGFSSLAVTTKSPFLQTLIANKTVSAPVFCLGLWTAGGRLDLGHIDTSAFKGKIGYTAIDASQGFWGSDFSINGISATGIIDTGTSIIVGSVTAVTDLFTKAGITVLNSDDQVFGLYDPKSPPHVELVFAGVKYTMSKDAMHYGEHDHKVVISIVGAAAGDGGWIIGDSFMQDVYAVFDVGNKRVGLAPRA